MKRPVVVAVVSAVLVGIGVGFLMASASETPSASAGSTPDLQVVSRWSGHPYGSQVTLLSGSLRADPGRGFALVQTRGLKPVFFSTPEGAGALRLESSSGSGWVLRSSNGARVLVSPGFREPGILPSFTYLGRRLNPDKLGPIGPRGIAVAFGYGRYNKNGLQAENDVVLVEQTKKWPDWKLYGYLPGFTLPRVVAKAKVQQEVLGTTQELKQPLLGPDGKLYSIDPKLEQLVPASAWRSVPRKFNFGDCTTWPARNGGSYRACPKTIRLRTANGATRTVFHRHLAFGGRSWVFAQPSPNGKWLLLQDAYGACGIATWSYFVPTRGGGPLWSAFAGAYTSEALGWLPDNTALIAAQSETCEGNQTNGIYQVTPSDPTYPQSQLVFAGDVFDATTWGFAGKSAR